MADDSNDLMAAAALIILPVLLAAMAEAPSTAAIIRRAKVAALAAVTEADRDLLQEGADVGESSNNLHAAVEALFSAVLPRSPG